MWRDGASDAEMMAQCGYVRQAAGENDALRRLRLIRKEERDSLKNFTKATLFSSVIFIITYLSHLLRDA